MIKFEMMKKILYIIAAAAVLLLGTSCQKDSDAMTAKLAADWHYTAQENGVTEDVWVSFATDGTFEMFQKVGDGPYWYTQGEYTLDPETKVLSGVYSDRYPWKYSYKVSISDKTLEMEAVELEGYKLTYAKEAIPAQVREKSLPLTKSEPAELFL